MKFTLQVSFTILMTVLVSISAYAADQPIETSLTESIASSFKQYAPISVLEQDGKVYVQLYDALVILNKALETFTKEYPEVELVISEERMNEIKNELDEYDKLVKDEDRGQSDLQEGN